MSISRRKLDFFSSPEGVQLKERLESMQISEKYKTSSTYSPNTITYEDNLIPFAEKHMNYLLAHPQLDPIHYISNLELMTRVR